jgi:hypothetical protein
MTINFTRNSPRRKWVKLFGREILCVSLKWWGCRFVEGHEFYPKLPKAEMGKKGSGVLLGRTVDFYPKHPKAQIGGGAGR